MIKYSPQWSIIRWELRQRRWSIIWWSIGIGLFLTVVMAVYPTFRDQAAMLDQSLQTIPESARSLFTDTADFLSPTGYLSSQAYYLMMPPLFSFIAIGLGTSLIAREEQNKTIELLLARPLSRTLLLWSKVSAGFLQLLLIGVLMAVVGAIEVAIIGFEGVTALSVFWVTMLGLSMSIVFGSIAFMLTALGRFGRGAAIGIATLIALGSYLLSSLADTVHWLVWPARLLPFHYYHPAEVLKGGASMLPILGYTIVSLLLIYIALLAFKRRDID